MTESDTLTHYGVKGMKWGVRKPKKKLTPAQKRARRYKIAGNTIQGVGIAMMAASAILPAMWDRSMNNANKRMQDSFEEAIRRGENVTRNRLADQMGITSYKTIELAFVEASGRWK